MSQSLIYCAQPIVITASLVPRMKKIDHFDFYPEHR